MTVIDPILRYLLTYPSRGHSAEEIALDLHASVQSVKANLSQLVAEGAAFMNPDGFWIEDPDDTENPEDFTDEELAS